MQDKTSSAHVSIYESKAIHHGSYTLPIIDTQVLSQDHITSESNLPIKSEERTSHLHIIQWIVSIVNWPQDLTIPHH